MKNLLVVALLCAGASASAQTAPATSIRPVARPEIPATLPTDVGICGGGAVVAAATLSSTGVGGVAAGVLLGICMIIRHDIAWHNAGNKH